ncbi:hypothetical protein CI102_9743 [Trichoderma harzianum]|nr:hypothetical protein CI102_9743 [Trichoderma harzianum]
MLVQSGEHPQVPSWERKKEGHVDSTCTYRVARSTFNQYLHVHFVYMRKGGDVLFCFRITDAARLTPASPTADGDKQ